MKKTLITSLLIWSALLVQAQQKATGYVYQDLNKNGKQDQKEKGIKNVAVTNGKEVVLTNKKGKYVLPVKEDNIISVIKPSNYLVPLNHLNIPQHYYIHKPKGSPQLKYKGVAPTGPLPKSIDFALYPTEQENIFKAFVFGDPQVYSLEQIAFFETAVVNEAIDTKGMSFGLSMGDEVGDKLNLFAPYTEAVAKIGLPWYNTIGNHDNNTDVIADSLSDESFEAHFGPSTYSFNYGKAHFIVLNNVLFPDPRDGKGYYGGFRKEQLEFIKNDLRFVPKDHLIVLAMHIPLAGPNSLFRADDRKALFHLLKDYPNTLSISAHTHIQRQHFFEKGDEWLQDKPHYHFNIGTTSADWYSGLLDKNNIPISTMRDGTPRGYGIINFKDNKFDIDYKVAGEDASFQMKTYLPDTLKKDSSATLFVNYFMGSNIDTLYYRIDNNEWKTLDYTIDFDPFYLDEVATWKSIKDKTLKARRPSNPMKSTHLWKTEIPKNLSPGKHIIDIRVKGLFNKTFTTQRVLLVE